MKPDTTKLVSVPKGLLLKMQAVLRQIGEAGHEGFALWSGRWNQNKFEVVELIIPEQKALSLESGVCVTVAHDELFRINRHLYESGRTLIAQIHTHPTHAYHSETDDAFPIVTTNGCFSIVIPNFAIEDFTFEGAAAYQLQDGVWHELSDQDKRKIFEIC